MRFLGLITALLLAASPAFAQPRNFVYLGNDELEGATRILDRPDIAGAQVVYSWRSLEPSKGVYDFSDIEHDLALVQARGKSLFIQIQDRFFRPEARYVPQYLLDGPDYGGGLARQFSEEGEGKFVAQGWVARQWDPAVRARFQALLAALARQFDGRVLGINLPESAVVFDDGAYPEGFSCDAYFEAEKANALFARTAFKHSAVVQFVNFWPCEWNNDKTYMSRFFEFALANRIGVGGPDIVPYQKPQMNNSYPFFHASKGKMALVAMSIQEPTLTYTNPVTSKRFTRAEFEAFATDYLGVEIIFWSKEAPWLAQPVTP